MAAYQAPSRAIARDLADGLVAVYDKQLPSADACFNDDTRVKPITGFRSLHRAPQYAGHPPP